ncbi:MAG TPA: TlyA family RNA methyltransferase [Polyangiaceae bacterium]|nr:TlyA family RNA methyltransferase [Polyangiaceae bacterium]
MTTRRPSRIRVDQLLVERGLAPTRNQAQALVMAGGVSSAGRRVDKAGTLLDADAELSVARSSRFVSRGGEKLDHALTAFAATGLTVAGCTAVDIGASTGGFSDCLLSRGAAKVYAVDVGYGQLAASLRADPRVVVRERTNARGLTRADFAEPVDLIVVDASFIGLGKLVPAVARILRAEGALVALVKPQFEAGKEAARRGRGVIRDAAVRERAIADARSAVIEAGFVIQSETDSALRGPKGNVERFLYAVRRG